jgi:CubicO group peptidase (beta-lactamase class C family)
MRKGVKVFGCSVIVLLGLVIAIIAYYVVQFVRLPDPSTKADVLVVATEAELAGAKDVAVLIEPIRKRFKLPALAAAAVIDGKTVLLGAVGTRRAGGTERVTVNDQFHLGSCTKSMTATLCAILIQQGKLRWESTIGEVFADQIDKISPAFRTVTLDQLLTHRSGLPEDRVPDPILWPRIWALSGPMLDQRRNFIELVLAQKPTAAPGEKFQYSNAGYTIAGAMCERVTGETWEDLIHEHLFTPLRMTTAGFGPPGSAGKVDQPWGHIVSGRLWKSMPPGLEADNPAVIGPAGTVHCSMGDWAKYAAFHLRGARGEESTLAKEVFYKLYAPAPDDPEHYSHGWLVADRGWAGGKVLWHAGSNTMWWAVIWLAPERNAAFMAATNVGSNLGFLGCDAAVSKMIKASNLEEKGIGHLRKVFVF